MSITKQTSSLTAKVSAKGWVVIPAELRRKYQIQPGNNLQVVDYGGLLSLVPEEENPVQSARGFLSSSLSLTQALLEERRVERTRDQS